MMIIIIMIIIKALPINYELVEPLILIKISLNFTNQSHILKLIY
jgi:hypothetical protein